MTIDTSIESRAQHENWLPILELAVQEVFEIMLGCRLEPAEGSEPHTPAEFTGMVGLAGALCGILTVSCSARSAREMANRMLGADAGNIESQIWDALGELSNMIAGNFKNKLSGMDGRCMLSVPTVITGGEFNFHSLADGQVIETSMLFEGTAIVVRLELHQ